MHPRLSGIPVARLKQERTNLRIDTQFFHELPAQCLGKRLAGLDLASGKLPLAGVSALESPLAGQHMSIANDQTRHHDEALGARTHPLDLPLPAPSARLPAARVH